MKKRFLAISTIIMLVVSLTGCSWNDIKSKFTGEDTSATGGAIVVEDYDPAECVTLGNYKGVEVDCTVTEDEVQDEITSFLNNNTTTQKIKKGTCKNGQTVNIDYVGKINGKKFDNGSAEDQSIELGNSGYISGFDEGVIGMKVGQKKDLHLQFPDDYSEKDLQGKKVVFTVKLNYIEKKVTPALTDKLVKKGSDYKTVAEFKAGKKEELAKNKKDSAGKTAMQTVESNSKFNKIPETLKQVSSKQLDAYYRYLATSYGYTDFSTFLTQCNMTQEAYNEELASSAESITKTQLVTEAIAKAEGIEVSDDEVKKEIDSAAESAGSDSATMQTQFKDVYGDALTMEEYYRINLLNEKVVEYLAKSAKIKTN